MKRSETIDLVTPEGVTLPFRLALPIERVLALAIDFGLQMVLVVCLLLVLLVTGAFGSDILVALLIIAWFLIQHGYFIYFEATTQGATPAKRWLGLRVVSAEGAELGLEAVVARSLARDFELLMPAMAVSGIAGTSVWLWVAGSSWVVAVLGLPFFTRYRQRAGDLIAGTAVVRLTRATLPRDEAAPSQRQAAPKAMFTPAQLVIYGEHELETLADVLRRHQSLGLSDYDLQVVAGAIARKIGYSEQAARAAAPHFLREFYREQRAALERRMLLGRRKASKHDV